MKALNDSLLKRIILFWVLLAILISGCTTPPTAAPPAEVQPTRQPTVTPIPLPTSTLTPLPTDTFTPTATPTFTPTSTPHPPLPSTGPYLLNMAYGEDSLVMLGADGQGRRVIELPKGSFQWDFPTALSPDSTWLAFYHGDEDWFEGPGLPANLTLSLINVADSSIHMVSQLLPEDYNPLSRDSVSYLPFSDWSPDGRYLAFASAIDGPLSDIYVFDMETGSTNRLTDLSLDISHIDWSPDGNWIYFESISDHPDGVYEIISCYAVGAQSTGINELVPLSSESWGGGYGWIAPDQYLFISGLDFDGDFDFRAVNVRTRRETMFWEYISSSFAVDYEKGLLIVSASMDENFEGTHIINFQGGHNKISDSLFWALGYLGLEEYEFIGVEGDPWNPGIARMSLVGTEGVVPLLDHFLSGVKRSPDRQWFVLFADGTRDKGLYLYSSTGELVRTITDRVVNSIIWRPDSKGLFFFSDNVYYLELPDGEPRLVELCKPKKECENWYSEDEFIWVP